MDYLLKPIRFERFLRAVNKVHARAALPPEAPATELTQPTKPDDTQDDTATDPVLWLKANKKQIRLPMTDILFIESMRDYTHFNLFN